MKDTVSVDEVSSSPFVTTLSSPPSAPFSIPHLIWRCSVEDCSSSFLPFHPINALLDHGSPVILIRESLVASLNLPCHRLHAPFIMDTTTPLSTSLSALTEWVKLQLHDPSNRRSSNSVRAIISPSLCTDMILGLLFLAHNNIVVDASAWTVIHKPMGFNLLSPFSLPPPPPLPHPTLKQSLLAMHFYVKALHSELKTVCSVLKPEVESHCDMVKSVDVVAAVRKHIECLAAQEKLEELRIKVKQDYADVFAPLLHIDDMPDKITCKIELMDMSKTIASQLYNCPRKFCSAWQTLIQQHLDAG